MLASALVLQGYPNRRSGVIAYPIIAILAFYVLTAWLATLVAASIVVGHAVVEVTQTRRGRRGSRSLYVAAAVMAAGI